jgi:hypothetical protein
MFIRLLLIGSFFCSAEWTPIDRYGQPLDDIHPENLRSPTNEDEERLVIDMFKGYNNVSFAYLNFDSFIAYSSVSMQELINNICRIWCSDDFTN